MEGIGIFALSLEANGFAQFKIKKAGINGWEIHMSEEDVGKPCYALYTGTENEEEREIIRNIYNGSWNNIPENIKTFLLEKSSNNNYGEIIKVLMITSSGSEGINLKNTRYVHIMEPYWHPVRTEQVIGRARRICSHQKLDKEHNTVEVFLYIMIFTKSQLDSEFAVELKLKDQSSVAPFLPLTTDQKLFEISSKKEIIAEQFTKAIKESSIDCATHVKSSVKEGLTCLSFANSSANNYAYNPNYMEDQNDDMANINKVKINWEAKEFKFTDPITGMKKQYILRMDTNQVYDYDSVVNNNVPVLIGRLKKIKQNDKFIYEIVRE
jgi:hypothetical protein